MNLKTGSEIVTKRVETWVGVGSNLGDSVALCERALEALQLLFSEGFTASSLYRTSPMGEGIDRQFVNAVCRLYTELHPRAVLASLQAIEQDLGKVAKVRGQGNRTIDLDLILYGEETLQEEELQVPHPGWWDRLFVLIPMQEVAPSIVWKGKRIWLADRIATLQQMKNSYVVLRKQK